MLHCRIAGGIVVQRHWVTLGVLFNQLNMRIPEQAFNLGQIFTAKGSGDKAVRINMDLAAQLYCQRFYDAFFIVIDLDNKTV